MPKLILTTACAAAALGLMACQQETNEANVDMNVEELNYADNMTGMEDLNMTNDMNMSDDMGNAADNATGNEAIGNSAGY